MDADLEVLGRRTPGGVRGLKPPVRPKQVASSCRTPGGVRGLKQSVEDEYNLFCVSHPGRGAWIETVVIRNDGIRVVGRTPGGVRGLKPHIYRIMICLDCRTPGGVRGLKQWRNEEREYNSRRTPGGVRGLKPQRVSIWSR